VEAVALAGSGLAAGLAAQKLHSTRRILHRRNDTSRTVLAGLGVRLLAALEYPVQRRSVLLMLCMKLTFKGETKCSV